MLLEDIQMQMAYLRVRISSSVFFFNELMWEVVKKKYVKKETDEIVNFSYEKKSKETERNYKFVKLWLS